MVSISWSHSLFLPVLIIIILMGAVGGGGTNGSSQSQNGVTYADHWSDGDPYTHNLLVLASVSQQSN